MVGYEIAKTRRRSKRAWLLVGLFLAADVLLVTGARVSFVGPVIALDYRYQTELAAVTAIALGLSVLPLRGALELVEVSRRDNFLDHWKRVTAAVLAGLPAGDLLLRPVHPALAGRRRSPRPTSARSSASCRSREDPVPLVDVGVPGFLMWAFAYPENTNSHVLRMFEDAHVLSADRDRQPVHDQRLGAAAPDGDPAGADVPSRVSRAAPTPCATAGW